MPYKVLLFGEMQAACRTFLSVPLTYNPIHREFMYPCSFIFRRPQRREPLD